MEELQNDVSLPSPEGYGRARWDPNRLILSAAILISALMISGALIYTQGGRGGDTVGPNPNERVEVSLDDDPMLGSTKAKVAIVEFSDFQCPYCRSFWSDTLPSLKKDYIDTGKVKLIYRDFPLSIIHAAAVPAAEASECADEQGKFWEYHDKMFSEQAKQGPNTIQFGGNDLKKWAAEVGVDTAKFNSCLDSRKYKSEVEKDLVDGTKAGVSGTPSFYINGLNIVGVQPYEVFKQAIEAELQ